jgi:hypothetical protein
MIDICTDRRGQAHNMFFAHVRAQRTPKTVLSNNCINKDVISFILNILIVVGYL